MAVEDQERFSERERRGDSEADDQIVETRTYSQALPAQRAVLTYR